jgi:hypothetical protein
MPKKRDLIPEGEKKAKGRPNLAQLARKKKSEGQQRKNLLAHINKDDSGSDHPKHTKPPAPSAPPSLSINEALMRSQSQPSQQSQQSHVVSAVGTGNVTATLMDAEQQPPTTRRQERLKESYSERECSDIKDAKTCVKKKQTRGERGSIHMMSYQCLYIPKRNINAQVG